MPAQPSPLPTRVPNDAGARVGVVCGVVAALLGLASAVVVTRDRAWGLAELADLPVDAAIAVGLGLGAALVFLARRGPRPVAWTLAGSGAAAGATSLASAHAATATSVTPLVQTSVVVEGSLWVAGLAPLVTLLPLLYPDGVLPGSHRARPFWRAVLVAVLAGIVAGVAATALHPETFTGRVVVARPFDSAPASGVLGVVAAALLLPAVPLCLGSLVVRVRRSSGLVRRQVLLLAGAAAVLILDLVAQPLVPADWRGAVQALSVLLVPAAVVVAVTRDRVYELDLVVVRAVVGLALAACLAAVLVTLVSVAALLVSADVVAVAVAAALTGLAAHPLASRLSAAADARLYGDRDPLALPALLSERLRATTVGDETPQVVVDTVVEVLRVSEASLRTPDGTLLARAASPGGTQASQEVVALDVAHLGRAVATLEVHPRAGQQHLSERDRELLDVAAGQVGAALSSAQAWTALRRSREHLVAAREEERRRLRRELHDGVGAALAGARLQVDSAGDLVADPTASRLLAAAGEALADAVTDVRRVTEDLRPAALDELGLAASLRALVERLDGGRLRVDVDVPALPPLEAAVEVAVHRIAAEALANAVRHAGASRVRLRVRESSAALHLEVIDDGVGMAEGRQPTSGSGLGLASIRQRAEEIGGTAHVGPGPDGVGTRVSVVLGKELA